MTKPPITRNRELKWLKVDSIIPNERNPRRQDHFTPDQLARLRSSIDELGVLEPVIVEPYNEGEGYLLIEGERRWRSAKLQNLKEIPAVIVNKMDEHDQLITMFNIHLNRRGWEMAEELTAIRDLKERNGHLTEEELAKELSMSRDTLRERLKVLAMDPEVIAKIAKGEIDYSSALRAAEVAKSMARKRPELVEELGGQTAIEKKLVHKAQVRGGLSQELVAGRRDLTDPDALTDAAVKAYVNVPETSMRQVRTQALEEARKIDDLAKDMNRLESRIRSFEADLVEAPNLKRLRGATASLIDAAQALETDVSEALHGRREVEPAV